MSSFNNNNNNKNNNNIRKNNIRKNNVRKHNTSSNDNIKEDNTFGINDNKLLNETNDKISDEKILFSPNELETLYLEYMNNKINNNSFFSPRPPSKNKHNRSSLHLRPSNYSLKNTNTEPRKFIFNKTMVISSLKPRLEESIFDYNKKTERHYSLPNIKLELESKTEPTDIDLDLDLNLNNLSNSLTLPNYSKTKTIYPKLDNLYFDNKNIDNKRNKTNKKHNLNGFNDNININYKNIKKKTNNEGHISFKSNYRLSKYLITISSNNYKVNNIINKYICKRFSLNSDIEEWVWYNLKYNFSLHINYYIDTYYNCNNYSIVIKYGRKNEFNLHNFIMDNNINNLDKEIKQLFETILKSKKTTYWELSALLHCKNTRHITYAILAPLQYYRLYLSYLSSNLPQIKYDKFIKILYHYGNIDIYDGDLQKRVKDILYY